MYGPYAPGIRVLPRLRAHGPRADRVSGIGADRMTLGMARTFAAAYHQQLLPPEDLQCLVEG